MMMKSKRIIFILLGALVFAGICASCNKSKVLPPRNCVVTLVKNINPLTVGDTIVLQTVPGIILQGVPVLTKTGKTFGGWFTDQTLITASAFDIVNTPIYLDKILYAKWK